MKMSLLELIERDEQREQAVMEIGKAIDLLDIQGVIAILRLVNRRLETADGGITVSEVKTLTPEEAAGHDAARIAAGVNASRQQRVIDWLRENGPRTRDQLAEDLGLESVIGNILWELIIDREIQETKLRNNRIAYDIVGMRVAETPKKPSKTTPKKPKPKWLPDDGTAAAAVLTCLQHGDAYQKSREIAEITGYAASTVSTCLTMLSRRGLVKHSLTDTTWCAA
jgi:chorismate mutase